ncbi:MAG: hypothetical protein FWG80_04515 [Alphaproteobacteria bacterium]|nr:hypothetical protein [Alphaproteobacteria bacterium]
MSVLSDLLQGAYDTVRVPDRMIDRFTESRRVNNSLAAHGYSAAGIPTDEYFHRLAVAEQSQKGVVPGRFALALGYLNEGKDVLIGKGWENSKKDLKNNLDGYKMGREYKTKNALSEALKQYQSKSLQDWDKKYNNENLF